LPDLGEPPFSFPTRFDDAQKLMERGIRSFTSTSMGRLFDAAAALLGFTHGVSFEGQAAIWLEQQARRAANKDAYEFPFDRNELDFRQLLRSVVQDRSAGRSVQEIARAFQRGLARGAANAIVRLAQSHDTEVVVLSGGVFQNQLLLEDVSTELKESRLVIWTNREVPANDGGISLGQAALAAFGRCQTTTQGAAHA
jgi:hydrogenase maturation protein HypF